MALVKDRDSELVIGVYGHFQQFFTIVVTTKLNGEETLDIYNELIGGTPGHQ